MVGHLSQSPSDRSFLAVVHFGNFEKQKAGIARGGMRDFMAMIRFYRLGQHFAPLMAVIPGRCDV